MGLFLAGFFASSHAFAEDFIDVKGKGVISGKIISENEKEVIFLGPDGISQTYAKSDILMMEKMKPSAYRAPIKAPTSFAPAINFNSSKSSPTSSSARALPSGPVTMEQIKSIMDERARARAQNTDFLTRANLWIEGVYMLQAQFFVSDLESLGSTVMNTINQSQRYQGNIILAILASIFAIAGGLGVLFFSFQMLIYSFRCGAGWGMLVLGNGALNYAAIRFGEIAVLVSHLCAISITYFVITRFQVLRKPMLSLLVCINFLLVAAVLIHAGFGGS